MRKHLVSLLVTLAVIVGFLLTVAGLFLGLEFAADNLSIIAACVAVFVVTLCFSYLWGWVHDQLFY